MPRKRRPGPRQNRTDLPAPGVAPGRPYGARQAAEEALEAVPAAGINAPGGPAPGGAGGEDVMAQFIEAARQAESPGQGLLGVEPDNPADITSGITPGPGPGPEVLPTTLGDRPDPSVQLWQQQLPALDLLASMPGSSPEVRQFYRRIRSQLPADVFEQRGPA